MKTHGAGIAMSLKAAASKRRPRGDWLVLALLVAATGYATFQSVHSPLLAGWYQDDGLYLVSGRALAKGRGYRLPHLPGEPYSHKAPPLYPLVLSFVWRAADKFPHNLAAMQILNGIFAAGAGWLGYRLARRAWDVPWWLAACGTLLFAANPRSIEMIRYTMSEHLFALLSLGALLLTIDSPANTGQPKAAAIGKRGLARAAACASLAGLAFMTRSIGVTVVAAVIGAYLVRRQWKRALCAALICGAFVGGWWGMQRSAAVKNEAIGEATALRYDLDYSQWIQTDARSLGRVAANNAAEIPYALFNVVAQPAGTFVMGLMQKGAAGLAILCIPIGFTTALCLLGLAAMWRRNRAPAVFAYLLFTFTLMCAWPFHPHRFLIPLLPLLATACLFGLDRVICWIATRVVENADRAANPNWLVLTPLCAGLIVWYHLPAHAAATAHDEQARQRGRTTMVNLIRRHTPPNAVVAIEHGAFYHLMTGRWTVPRTPLSNPMDLYYPPEREIRHLGLRNYPSYREAFTRTVETELESYYRDTRVTHIMLRTAGGPHQYMAHYFAQRPRDYREVASKKRFRLFERTRSAP